ncbi:MAG: rhodanese-like domain-containing protein [Pleurocapsa sp. SU_196_0]|nr:rhodanese-like domain-containing protein [Pleurocapsa sp. SU_196_0]
MRYRCPASRGRKIALVFDRVNPQEAQSRLQNGAVLVDVRERDEFEAARVAGATLIPLSEFGERYTELPQGQEIVLICAGGVRSARAAEYAASHGYTVTNLEGGINAWAAAGLPVETGGTP